MTKHFILEIDEGSLSLVVVEIHRKKVNVIESRKVTLSSMEGSALVFALHDVLKEQDTEGAQVHVVLSDPNFLQFDLPLPRLERSDQEAVMIREARRLGSIPEEDDVLLGSRRINKVNNGSWRHAVVALPDKSVQPIRDALAREGLEIHSLTSVEEAAVRLLPKSIADATLFLDHGAGRIRFVFVEDGVITQRRHILAPGLDDNGGGPENGFWVDQLSMEIGWNLDYLGDMGKSRPECLVLSQDLDFSEEQIEKISGELNLLPGSEALYSGPDGRLTQATQGIIRSLVIGDGISVCGALAHSGRVDGRLVLWTALSSALCLASIAVTGWVMNRGLEISGEITRGETQLQGLQLERQAIGENLDAIELSEERSRLRKALGSRRPLSLFLAECCSKVPTGISLIEVRVQPDGALHIRGRASGPDRLASLDLVKAYRQSLQELGFLERIRERVERFAGAEAWLDFLIVAHWRKD